MVLGPVPMGTDLSEGAREKLRDHPLWGGLGPLPLHRKAGAQARRRGPWVEAQEELGGGCRGPGLWSGEAWATAGEAAALAEGGQRQHRGSLAPARPPTECCPATARRALGRPALTPPACLSPEAEACVCGRPQPRLLQNWRPCSTPVGLPAGLLQGQVGAGPALLRPRSPGGRAGRRGSANVSPPKAWVGGSAYFREGPPHQCRATPQPVRREHSASPWSHWNSCHVSELPEATGRMGAARPRRAGAQPALGLGPCAHSDPVGRVRGGSGLRWGPLSLLGAGKS